MPCTPQFLVRPYWNRLGATAYASIGMHFHGAAVLGKAMPPRGESIEAEVLLRRDVITYLGLQTHDGFANLMTRDIFVIHENHEWTRPLYDAFERHGLNYVDWFIDDGAIDFTQAPPVGVFYNRMSASSHTRGHRFAPELVTGLLAWLQAWRRPIVNGSGAVRLEVAKTVQYAAMATHGIPFPATIAAVSPNAILAAYDRLGGPVITKHNRAGKGLGVRLFRNRGVLEAYIRGAEFEPSVDGITLVQRYVECPEGLITRVEFIGSELVYAVRVDTSEGFELCPADACELPNASPRVEAYPPRRPKFEIVRNFRHPLVPAMKRLMAGNDIQVAAFEYVTDPSGRAFVYDINTNTNYNAEAERRAGISAMDKLATYLSSLARAQAV